MSWIELKNISIEELAKTRKQIHQAAQLPAITGRCLNPKDSGDAFAALYWDNEQNVLSSQPWEKSGFRSILSISDFELVIIEEKKGSNDSFKLNGKTYDEAFNWLKEKLNSLGFEGDKLNKSQPYQIPEYPTAKGEPFKQINNATFTELQNYFSNAAFVLENLMTKQKGASKVLCWPHHFDIATLITIEKNPDPEKTKTIGVGLSPGDESYNEPYFYVSPWPYPENKNDVLKLDHGHWHDKGWFGGVLTATEIIKQKDKSKQLKIAEIFIEKAIHNLKNLL